MFLFDTREKRNEHIKEYFRKNNIEFTELALDIGDYMLYNGTTTIDRKKNLQELATNLFNPKDKARFWREVRRAKDKGIKLIILCEHGGKIHSIKDVKGWHNKYGVVDGNALMNEIYRVHISYGVDFYFCDKRSTAKMIISLLTEKR